MKLVINIIFFLLSFSGISQESDTISTIQLYTEKDSTFEATYNQVKELYIRQLKTASYQKKRLIANEYKKKWRSLYDGTGAELAKDAGGLKWLRKNWQKTKFKSYEEAVKEFEAVLNATRACQVENAEFNKAYFNAVRKYGAYIYIDLEEEMQIEYPDLY